MAAIDDASVVSVRSYLRCWQGVWQQVREHTRDDPEGDGAESPTSGEWRATIPL